MAFAFFGAGASIASSSAGSTVRFLFAAALSGAAAVFPAAPRLVLVFAFLFSMTSPSPSDSSTSASVRFLVALVGAGAGICFLVPWALALAVFVAVLFVAVALYGACVAFCILAGMILASFCARRLLDERVSAMLIVVMLVEGMGWMWCVERKGKEEGSDLMRRMWDVGVWFVESKFNCRRQQ